MEFEGEQSEFNDALGKLDRINRILYDIHQCRAALDAYGWLHSLIAFYTEIYAYVKTDKEREWFETERKAIAEQINKNLQQRAQTVHVIESKLYERMLTFELKLRKEYKDSGLEMKMKDDPRKASRG